MFDDDELAAIFTAGLSQVSLADAVTQTPFTVLVPDQVPTGLKRMPFCKCGKDLPPPLAPFVTMIYAGGAEGRNVVIHQIAAVDVPQSYPAAWREDASWREVDGVTIRGPGEGPEVHLGHVFYERWLGAGTGDHRPWDQLNPDEQDRWNRFGTTTQAEAYLERDKTFAYLKSQGLSTDELATIAASLRPASEADGEVTWKTERS